MRKVLLSVVLGAILSSGCSVLEEIDKIGADASASKQAGDGREEGADAEEGRTPVGSWENVQNVTSAEMKSDVVSCRIGGTTRFTSRSACLARGGKPDS